MKLPLLLIERANAHEGHGAEAAAEAGAPAANAVAPAAEKAVDHAGEQANEAGDHAEAHSDANAATHTEAHSDTHTETHAAHDAHAIPWPSITVQGFNLAVLLVILFFALRKTVKALFINRAAEYKDLVSRADAAKAEAEAKHRLMSERMAKLDQSASQSASQARAEAAELKTRLIAEAKALSQKLEEEARRTTGVEIEKAKTQLRHELLTEALAASKAGLQSGLGSGDQKKLQNEFVEKIQVVGN